MIIAIISFIYSLRSDLVRLLASFEKQVTQSSHVQTKCTEKSSNWDHCDLKNEMYHWVLDCCRFFANLDEFWHWVFGEKLDFEGQDLKNLGALVVVVRIAIHGHG